jgi:hypothetical protein
MQGMPSSSSTCHNGKHVLRRHRYPLVILQHFCACKHPTNILMVASILLMMIWLMYCRYGAPLPGSCPGC